MGKKYQKKKSEELEIVPLPIDENPPLPQTRSSDEQIPKKDKWINKQRVLVFAARGISHRDRHLMRDIKTLMPHHRPESKMERSKTLSVINEICKMKHCNKAILFEGRRKRDLYMWASHIPSGPSAKFLIQNAHTMGELKMTGNCLRGSRPLLSFDAKFDEIPHLILLKELFTQIFGVPNHHPKSQPFIDHVYTFTFLDNRIWFRNFQVLSEDGGLAEIGPRFIMNPVKIFEGSFTGRAIWENSNYVSPARQRQMLKKIGKEKYVSRVEQKVHQEATKPTKAYKDLENDHDLMFEGKDIVETAEKIKKRDEQKLVELEKMPAITKKQNKIKENQLKAIKDKQMNAIKEVILKKKEKGARILKKSAQGNKLVELKKKPVIIKRKKIKKNPMN